MSGQAEVAAASDAGSDRVPWSERIDLWADRWSDRFNPVVVREIRQEFQGVRFGITLMLSLIAAWLASVFGVIMLYDRIRQPEIGDDLFGFFFAVLAFPLCLVVPFGLFRSMTSEFVGTTWELLVVTPMGAAKIVRGKVATAMLQAAIYMALLAPFLCFTWLLKGIGVMHIVLGLTLLIIACFSLCHLALFCGSLIRKAAWQGFGLIVLMTGSLFVWGFLCGVVPNAGEMGLETWIGGGICVGIGLLYMIVVASATAVASLTPTYPIYNSQAVLQASLSGGPTRQVSGSGGSGGAAASENQTNESTGDREETR